MQNNKILKWLQSSFNTLYTCVLFHYYNLDESICHFRGVWSNMSLQFYFWWKNPVRKQCRHWSDPTIFRRLIWVRLELVNQHFFIILKLSNLCDVIAQTKSKCRSFVKMSDIKMLNFIVSTMLIQMLRMMHCNLWNWEYILSTLNSQNAVQSDYAQ